MPFRKPRKEQAPAAEVAPASTVLFDATTRSPGMRRGELSRGQRAELPVTPMVPLLAVQEFANTSTGRARVHQEPIALLRTGGAPGQGGDVYSALRVTISEGRKIEERIVLARLPDTTYGVQELDRATIVGEITPRETHVGTSYNNAHYDTTSRDHMMVWLNEQGANGAGSISVLDTSTNGTEVLIGGGQIHIEEYQAVMGGIRAGRTESIDPRLASPLAHAAHMWAPRPDEMAQFFEASAQQSPGQ